MAFRDLLDKLNEMAQSGKGSQPTSNPETQRLINLQNEVSEKLGVQLEGIPNSEDEIVQKAGHAIQNRNPQTIRQALQGSPKLQSLTSDTDTRRNALETAIRLPALASQGFLHNISFGLIPKALPPAETPIEKLWAGAGSGSGSLGAGGIVRAGAQKVLPVAKSAASVASTLPTSVKVGAGIGTGAIGVPIVQGTTTPDDTNRSFLQQTGASLRAGVGDVASTAGGTAKWLGAEELGENLSETGQNIREGYETQYSKPFTWKSFFDPEFYSTTVARAVPFTASLIPAMVAGYKGAGSLVGKTSLSPFQKAVVSSLGGAAVSRPIESALEAGGVYDEAIARGMDEQQADAAASEVFKKNLALGGLDAAQLAVAFAPAPFKAAGTAGKVAMGAGRIGAGALTEAGEEGYQEVIQRQALGDEVAFDDAMKQSMAVGGIFGAGMGGFGVVNDMIRAKVAEKTGIPQEQLNDDTLDAIAENEQGKQIINEATQEAVSEYAAGNIGTPGANVGQAMDGRFQNISMPQQQEVQQEPVVTPNAAPGVAPVVEQQQKPVQPRPIAQVPGVLNSIDDFKSEIIRINDGRITDEQADALAEIVKSAAAYSGMPADEYIKKNIAALEIGGKPDDDALFSSDYSQVGKNVGNSTYVHKSATDTLSAELQNRVNNAASKLPENFTYDVVRVDKKKDDVSFMQSPDWDTAPEPIISSSVKVVDGKAGPIRKESQSNPTIYHGKGFMVKDDYPGFDKQESIDRYNLWNERNVPEAGKKNLIGRKKYWEETALPAVKQATQKWQFPQQEISSAATSINASKLPRTFSTVDFKPGTVNADIGGGRFDNVTEHLATKGVANYIYDPFNRDATQNKEAVSKISGGRADTATINNVLNVIKEAGSREQVIANAADAIKPNGTAYFLIYTGDSKNRNKPQETKAGWQNNWTADRYIPELRKYFGAVTKKGDLLIATKPKKDLVELYSKQNGLYRSSVEFSGPDGRAIIRAFEQSDVAAMAHELAHIFRRTLNADDLRIAEEYAGVEDGDWTVEAEEHFAEGFEQYLHRGKSPSNRLKKVFEQFKQWLTQIYVIIKPKYGRRISPEITKVFDRIMAGNPDLYKETNISLSDLIGASDKRVPAPVNGDIQAGDTVITKDGKTVTVVDQVERQQSPETEAEPEPEIEQTLEPEAEQQQEVAATVEPEPKPQTAPDLKQYGRKGKAAFMKWGKNEYVNADMDNLDDPYTKSFIETFDKYYRAGFEGRRIPFTERQIEFPPFLEDIFIRAGKEDAETQAKRQAKKEESKPVSEPEPEPQEEVKPEPEPQEETTPEPEPETTAPEQSTETTGKYIIEKSKHTKTGADIWVVKLKNKVGRDEFNQLNKDMRKIGGYYSRFAKGFVFKVDPSEKLDVAESKSEPKPEQNQPETTTQIPETGVKSNQEEPEKGVGQDEVSNSPTLDQGAEGGTGGAGGPVPSGTNDDSIRGTRGEQPEVFGSPGPEGTSDIPIQSGEKRGGDTATDLHPPDSGINEDQGPSGETDGADDSKNRQRRGDGKATEGSAANEGTGVTGNYVINEENPVFVKGSKKVRYQANIDALKVMDKVLTENRSATLEEQRKLALFSGWGALPEALDYTFDQYSRKRTPTYKNWAKEYYELETLLNDLEERHFKQYKDFRGSLHQKAGASTQNAHFTSPQVIASMYEALKQLGFKKGNVLEPSMGIGNFFGMLPGNIRSKLYGVELDPVTGTIATLLYPNADIRISGFQDTFYPDNLFDVAIGNVPFGNVPISDNKYPDFLKHQIHNYFFAKTIDKVRPGGIIAFITSTGTLDASGNKKVRDYFARKANLVGAIRLPGDAFKDNAGTEVTTDIIFLQKLHDGELPQETTWTDTGKVEVDGEQYSLSNYYINNPHMIIGDLTSDKLHHTRLGAKNNGQDVSAAISRLIQENLPSNIISSRAAKVETELPPEVQAMAADMIDGGISKKDGKLYRKLNGEAVEITKNVKQISALVDIRDLAKEVLSMQRNSEVSDRDIEAKRKKLKSLYEGYVKQHGNLLKRKVRGGKLFGKSHVESVLGYTKAVASKNKKGNVTHKSIFISEPETYLLKSLEIETVSVNENGVQQQAFKPALVLTQRTYKPTAPINNVTSASDGVIACLNDLGYLDIEHISKIYGKSEEEVISELGDKIFKNPKGSWETDDEYLSGNVRRKLAAVEELVAQEPEYQRNIDALRKVIPADAPLDDVTVNLGDAWVPYEVTHHAVAKLLGFRPNSNAFKLHFSPFDNTWTLSKGGSDYRVTAEIDAITAGIPMTAFEIVKKALNNSETTVTYKDSDGKTYVDKNATNTLKAKVKELRESFKDFVYDYPDYVEATEKAYNNKFKAIVPRDMKKIAEIFTFPNMNPGIKLRMEQKIGIVRALLGGNTLIAHGVGVGKTYEQIAIAMEAKRLGLANKPVLVVPNTKLTDFENDAKALYPGSKVLALSDEDFEASSIKRTLAMAAFNEWDMVIVRHSSLTKIPVSPQTEIPALQAEIQELEEAMAAMDDESRYSKKKMESRLEKLRAKLENYQKNKQTYKGMLYFEDMGFDMLIVDEAHEYKNYPLTGRAAEVKGLKSGEANKARDMMIKANYIKKVNGGNRGVVFATGTPISNSMAEVYVMFKYLRPDLLIDAGISNFDAWADAFADITNVTEIAPRGKFSSIRRFKEFVNLPELITMFKEFTDIKLTNELDLPLPEAEFIKVECDPHPGLAQLMKEIDADWDTAARERRVLSLYTKIRSAPQDMRLVDPTAEDHKGSKVNKVAERVAEVYKAEAKHKGTQLIFLARGVSTSTNFNLWEEIKNKLIKAGIPAGEIAFVKSGTKESDLEEIYQKANAGKIRVVIGSYGKLGVGVNVQERLAAIHEVDVPFKPSDLEQSEGRMIRQGNMYYDIKRKTKVFRYVTIGEGETFSGDALSWQIIEGKVRDINAVMKGDPNVRRLAMDTGNDPAMMKATALGDPRWMRKVDLERDIDELRGARNSYRSGQSKAKSSLQQNEKALNNYQYKASAIEIAQSTLKKNVPENGPLLITVGDKSFDVSKKKDRAKADKLIRKKMEEYEKDPRKNTSDNVIAKYHGISLEYRQEYDSKWRRVFQRLEILARYRVVDEVISRRVSLGKGSSDMFLSEEGVSVIDIFLRAIKNLPKTAEKTASIIERLKVDNEKYKDILSKPFKKQEELDAKMAELKEIDHALGMDAATMEAGANIEEVGSESEEDTGEETSQTRAVEEKLNQKIADEVGDISQGGFIRLDRLGLGNRDTEPGFEFSNAESEARWRAAKGVPKIPVVQKVKEGLARLKNIATREFEHLPRTGEFSKLRYELSRLQKQKGVTGDRTLRNLQAITLKMNSKEYDLFTRKVVLDDLAGDVVEGRKLPFGFTGETVEYELERVNGVLKQSPQITEAVDNRKELWDAIKEDYIKTMSDIGFNVGNRFNRENYFRHQVLEYVNAKRVASGTGKKLRTPTGRGFLKKRGGSELDINSDYLQAEYEVMAQMLLDIEIAKTIKTVDNNYNIAPQLKAEAKKMAKDDPDADIDWHDLIPEGYTLWQPREGTVFYFTDSVPASIAERLYEGAAEELGVKAEDLRKVLARGQRYREFAVKEEIAETLDNITKVNEGNVVSEATKKLQQSWKVWTLVSPRRWFKYNARNMTGDADAVFAGNPSAFKKLPQATNELFELFTADKMTPNLRDWVEEGGMQTLLQAQELGDINKLKMFVNLMQKKGTIKELPTKAWQGYWKGARLTTDFREALLRYAAYLDYLEQMQKNKGKPKNFGASIPEEVMALNETKQRAFKLSNELLGAYDQVGVLGQALRSHVIPFWSWNEVNFRRYKQLIINAANDGKTAHIVGRKLLAGAVVKSPLIAYRVGKLALMATALWIMLDLWNKSMFPELEETLSPEERKMPHIIFGQDEDGNTLYFSRLGAMQDFVDWFGVDAGTIDQIREILNGKKSVKEVAAEMVKQPVNKLVQGVGPLIKNPAEAVFGYKLFPDAFSPRPIRDRVEYIFQSLGLDSEYRAIAELPSKPYQSSLRNLFVYTVDPKRNAYYNTLDNKREFQKKINKYNEGSFSSPKSDALYYFKEALYYKDRDAAFKYLQQYIERGGTGKGLQQSLESKNPLYGLNEDEKIAFIKSLNREQLLDLKQAIEHYDKIYGNLSKAVKRANKGKD